MVGLVIQFFGEMVLVKPVTQSISRNDSLNKMKVDNYLNGLKPWLILMRCIGIDLSNQFSQPKKWFSLLFAFVLFFFNVYTNIYFLLISFDAVSKPRLYSDIPGLVTSSTTETWNLIIDTIIYVILVVGSNCLLLIMTWHSKWKELWRKLEQMASNQIDSSQFQTKCQRVSLASVFFFLLVSSKCS